MSRTRSTQRKPSLVNIPPQLDRQSRRINRQQAKLDKDLVNQMGQNYPAKLTGATGRQIKLSDIKRLEPLTDTQERFFDAYEDGGEAFVLYGSAGTGKSTIALGMALQELFEVDSAYDKIMILRSTVPTRSQGFLKGTVEEKELPFTIPYYGIMEFLTGRKDAYEKLTDIGKLEFMSTMAMRGITIDNTIIVVDEFSSMTWHELKTITTRVGKNTKIIFCGDYAQNDLLTNKNDVSGFKEFMEVTTKMKEFQHFRFTTDDIVRSPFIKSFLIQAERLGL